MKVDQFLENLINFDKENIAEPTLKAVLPYLANREFDPNFVRNKSFAAAGERNKHVTSRMLFCFSCRTLLMGRKYHWFLPCVL